jgi:hypothetical protein
LFQGLRDLGYVDGQTITIDCFCADGHGEPFSALAADCLRLKADIIVVTTTRLLKPRRTQLARITRVRLQEALLAGAAVSHRLGVTLTALTRMTTGSGSASVTARPATTIWWWEPTASIRPCASSR